MSDKSLDKTMMYRAISEEEVNPKDILQTVYNSLEEKGYNPINQIVGYLLSGDPAYITSYKDARTQIKKIERDDLMEELVKKYLEK